MALKQPVFELIGARYMIFGESIFTGNRMITYNITTLPFSVVMLLQTKLRF